MAAESASDRQQQWALVVRRSFGISDFVAHHNARVTLVGLFERQLHEEGWQGPARAIAESMMETLLAAGWSEDLEDPIFPVMSSSVATISRDAAELFIDRGVKIVDPEGLVLDPRGQYPDEIVAAVQQVLGRVLQYVREHPQGA